MATVKPNSKSKKYDEWEVEDAMRTLMRAHEIRKDNTLMKMVQSKAKEKLMQLASVASEGKDDS